MNPILAPAALRSRKKRPKTNSKGRLRARAGMLGGAAAALLCWEILLRFISTPMGGDARPWGREVRQYGEGIATSNFYDDGSRVTGNGVLPSAPTGLLFGDSFVEAYQVSDRDTMGSVLERRFRLQGYPVNVRQYGKSGVAGPHYAAAAPGLVARWRPKWVVVFLNRGDLGLEAVRHLMNSNARFDIRPDGSYALIVDADRQGTAGGIGSWVTHHSTLLHLIHQRFAFIAPSIPTFQSGAGSSAPKSDDLITIRRLVPLVTVRALKASFGPGLLLVYDGDAPGGESIPDPERQPAFMAACENERVYCLAVDRDISARAREQNIFARGFSNTSPNEGHYNEHGHSIIAGLIESGLMRSGLVDRLR
jgi:hypothetical protein